MIKNLFIPNSINGYFLVAQKILSFNLLKDRVSAAQIIVTGRTLNIQAVTHQALESDNGLTYEEQMITAIKALIKRQKFHQVTVAIPSQHTIFKELTLPFLDPQKIKQVLNFEIENSLPFTVDKAVVSFVILSQNLAQKTSAILAAVVQKKDLDYYQELFRQAGLKNIDRFSIELFDTYALAQQIPAYQTDTAPYVLADVRDNSTNLLYIRTQKLKYARVLPKGLVQIMRQFSHKAKIAYPEALAVVASNSNLNLVANTDLHTSINEYLNSWAATFAAFSQNINIEHLTLDLAKILILESDLELPPLTQLAQQTTQINCEHFNPNLLLENRQFKTAVAHLTMADWGPLAAAYSATSSDHSALEYTKSGNTSILLRNQIIMGLVLSLLILGFTSIKTYLEIHTGHAQLQKAEKEALNKLNSSFNLPAKESKNLATALKAATERVAQEHVIWFAFSSRFSCLEYLHELSILLNPEELGLKLKRLAISAQVINLQGKVGDIKYVPTLIHDLESSQLFELEKRPQSTDFDIQLNIKAREEQSV